MKKVYYRKMEDGTYQVRCDDESSPHLGMWRRNAFDSIRENYGDISGFWARITNESTLIIQLKYDNTWAEPFSGIGNENYPCFDLNGNRIY